MTAATNAIGQHVLSLKKLTLADALLIFLLPGLFHVTFSGPANEFANRDTFFDTLGNTDSNISNQIATLVLFGMGIYQFYKCRMSFPRVLTIALPFIPFLVWALLSITWSEFPGISLRRSARLVIEMTGVMLLAMSYANEPERFIRIFFYVCLVFVGMDLLILPIPSYSWSQIGYVGLHFHKQYTGRFLFIAIPLFIIVIANARFCAEKRLGYAGLAISLLLLPLTQAKTIWAALPVALVGAAVVLGTFREDIQKATIAFACFGMCGVIGLALVLGLDSETFLERVFGDSTLTGRDQIWRFAFSKYYGNEVLGVGYGALWQTGTEVVDRLRDGYKIYVVNEAHNGYIDVLVQTGLGGAACLAFALVSMLALLAKDAGTLARTHNYLPFMSLVLFFGMLIVNITDSTVFLTYTSLWAEPVAFFALTRAVALKQRDEELATTPAPQRSAPQYASR